MIFSIKPQIFELKCVFSYFRLKTHITLLLPVYVHSWEQRKLSDCAGFRRGSFPQPYGNKDWYDGEGAMPFVQVADVSDDMKLVDDTKQKISKLAQPMSVCAEEGSVLVTLQGSIGRVAIMQYKAFVDRTVLIFDKYNADIDKTFWAYIIKEKFIEEARKAPGGTIKTITKEVLSDFDLMLPSYDEQKMLGKLLHSLDHLITLHQCKCQIDGCRFQSPLAITWEQRKVREVTDRYDNLRIPVAASLRVAGTTPYYGANGIQDYVDGYTHDGEFILVAEEGANDLKNYPVKCVKGRIWVNNHAHVLQGKYDCADNQFLAYAISQADIESLLVGGGRAKLNAETLMGIDLLLPNKAEQIRIGKYLAQLDNLITLHQRKYDKLTNVKKSMLEKMFPQNGSNAPEIRFKGFTEAWEQRKVTEIGKIYIGLVTTMTKHYTDEGTLLIRNSDIKDGKFEFGDNPIYLEKTFAEKNETRMHQIGDVITVHTGDVGTSAVITENEAKSIGFATIVTRPNPKIIDSNYLCSFLNTDKHKKWAVSISTGDGRTNYNLGDYFELVVPVPSIAEQKKIASYIQKLNRLITLHQRELEKLKNLKKACLEKMFV